MLLLISYQSMLFSVVEYYFDFFEEMQVALVSKNRLKELSQLEKEEFGNKKLKTIDFVKGENLFYKYPNQGEEAFLLDAIKGEKGEIVRIEGENGKGKSSLIYYLLGILSNEETKNISYQEISFQDLSIKDFRQDHTFTVLQYPIFYHEKPKDLVENYMDWELFSEKTKEGVYPFDLRDLGDKYFQEMSYGQRQKWSILEAALANKSIVFFDEPTASLDGESVNSFVRWLGEFKKNKITFLISHDARLNGLEEKRIHL
ncbi:ATP-binding cassette domain-containing protein [Peptoniphilus sp. KCTC 25270]|uniref:ATP-binding cassette domain-containing protein n=1 Tax=Peptoniphilus sp. KCTC 25270 TaxID=2897414 RepID=UPI001E3C312E|nr:ATP-binding cassette domain-containing protein [Peptoniphilus sp. KCTC 25270]MCD1148014.1 ATP-binding cassette domain-containing protein [Peptoniphilus sp. KCTC 25270]